jgi:hypothetical protein
LEEIFHFKEIGIATFDISKVFFIVLTLAHLISCIFNLIAKLEHEAGVDFTWLSKINITDEPWEVKYLNGFYFAVITM